MRRFTIYILAILVAFTSCTKDEYAPGNIDIEFQFESLPVDLNVVDNPFITCIVRSETGLDKVQMLIEMNDGKLVPYKTEINEFFNPRHCSIHERPVYTDDMTAFVVRAADLGGAVKEGRIAFEIKSKVNAPVITLNTEGIAFAEGEPIPQFSFSVSSDADLESVAIELIQSATSSELVAPVVDFTDARNFEFDSSTYELNPYDINRIPQLIRIVAVDTYGKTSISTLKISYRALPAPLLSVAPVETAVEFENLSVSGTATSETGIAKVECYTIGDNYECLASSSVADGATDYQISMTVPGNEIRDYVKAIKVVVTDVRNKTSETNIDLEVTPVFELIGSSDNLVEQITSRFNDPKYRTVKLLIPSGASYTFSSALKITKNLMLKSESPSAMPQINVTSSYTFDTDATNVDLVSFENISFETTASASFFMGNQSSAASVAEIALKSCRLSGYVNAFYRTGARADIGSILIEDSNIFWANTNSNYSFLHFTQTSGTLSNVKITNTTVTGVLYLHYNNLKDTNCQFEVSNCTFANSKGSNNCYFISYGNSSVKGNVILKKNLFGGSNNVTGNCRMLRANNVTKDCSDNYCTNGWKTFADDSTNGSVNFCTVLPDTEDNADLFTDCQNNDFTITPGTTVYEYGIGDPRWIN